jgi:hypothetical protein
MQTFFADFKSPWTPLMSFSLAKKHQAARSWKDFGQKTAEKPLTFSQGSSAAQVNGTSAIAVFVAASSSRRAACVAAADRRGRLSFFP